MIISSTWLGSHRINWLRIYDLIEVRERLTTSNIAQVDWYQVSIPTWPAFSQRWSGSRVCGRNIASQDKNRDDLHGLVASDSPESVKIIFI